MRLFLPLLLSLFTSTLALKGTSVRTAPSSLVRRRTQEDGSTESGTSTLTDKKTSPSKESGAGLVSKDKADKTGKTDKTEKGKKDKAEKGKKDKKEKKCKKAKKESKRRQLPADMPPAQAPDAAPDALPGAGLMAVPEDPDAALQELPYCLHGEKTARVCDSLKQGKPPKQGGKKVNGDLSLEITHDGNKSPEEVAEKVGDILRSETPIKFLGCTGRRRLFLGGNKEEDGPEEVESGENEVEEEEESLSVVGLDFGTSNTQKCESRGFWSGGDNCGQVVSDVKIFFDGKSKPTKEEKEDMFDLLVATVESLAVDGAFDEVGTVENVGSSASSSGSGGATIPVVTALLAAAAVGGGIFLYKRQRSTKQHSTEKGGETDESDDEVVEAHVVSVEEEDYKGKDEKKKKYDK